MPVVYRNIPTDRIIINELPGFFTFKVKGHGFALLQEKLRIDKDPVVIDVERCVKKSEGNSYVATNSHNENIENNISSQFAVQHIYPDTVYFNFSKIYSKKVAVKANLDLSFDKQFQLKAPVSISPDSIEISGPRNILDTVFFVYTNEHELKNLNRSTRRNIGLKKIRKVNFAVSRVVVFVDVEKYTEQLLSIPVDFENLPDTIDIEPKVRNVTAKFIVGLSRFNNYSAEDFSAIVDCDTLQYKPDLLRVDFSAPEELNVISFFPKEIDYIIKKK